MDDVIKACTRRTIICSITFRTHYGNSFSIWLFNEPLTLPKVIGATLIILGVLFLAKPEKSNVTAQS